MTLQLCEEMSSPHPFHPSTTGESSSTNPSAHAARSATDVPPFHAYQHPLGIRCIRAYERWAVMEVSPTPAFESAAAEFARTHSTFGGDRWPLPFSHTPHTLLHSLAAQSLPSPLFQPLFETTPTIYDI